MAHVEISATQALSRLDQLCETDLKYIPDSELTNVIGILKEFVFLAAAKTHLLNAEYKLNRWVTIQDESYFFASLSECQKLRIGLEEIQPSENLAKRADLIEAKIAQQILKNEKLASRVFPGQGLLPLPKLIVRLEHWMRISNVKDRDFGVAETLYVELIGLQVASLIENRTEENENKCCLLLQAYQQKLRFVDSIGNPLTIEIAQEIEAEVKKTQRKWSGEKPRPIE